MSIAHRQDGFVSPSLGIGVARDPAGSRLPLRRIDVVREPDPAALANAAPTVPHPVIVPSLPPHPATADRPAAPVSYEASKRAFDALVALALLICLAPLLLAIILLVRLTSPGPVFYRQVRCGRLGQPFTCLKFRSMVANADELQQALTDLNELSGPVFKMRRDPRVTPVGRWLRKLSLDELPQLWNVLRGEMSLVGPRPPLPAEVALYDARQRQRLDVTPGLTCLWQVSGRSDVSFDRWVEMDLEYIQRRSFIFDLWLVLLTIPAVITGRGAF